MYLLFFAVWLIFNGQITLEIVLFGLAVAAAVYAFVCRFMDWSPKKDRTVLRCLPLMVLYLVVLLREIFKANAATIRLILAPDLEPEPVLVRFRVNLRSQTALIRPKIIICLGRIAAMKFIKEDFKITREHGQWFEKDGILRIALFHPAALLRDPRRRPETFEDLKVIQAKILEICDHTY